MAANTYWQLEKEYYTIAKEHDLVVRLVEHDNVAQYESGRIVIESEPSKIHEYRVKRDALSNSSRYFRNLLSDVDFNAAGLDTIELREDNATGMTVWLKLFHGLVDDTTTYQATISDIWHMLAIALKYGFDPQTKAATTWFEGWYDAQTNMHGHSFDYVEYQQLLYPCYSFDHAQGFRSSTKYLVYRATGEIVERRPEGFEYPLLRMDPNILHQLNAAKSRLKIILHRNLYRPIDDLLNRAHCHCKANILYGYERALNNTGAWPLETAFLNNSVGQVLKMLENFPRQRYLIPHSCGAGVCGFKPSDVVENARLDCKNYFDGLCLDCMNASDPNFGHADADYWKRSNPGVHWDQGCRITHQQSSWYFSFLGLRQKMIEWVKSKR